MGIFAEKDRESRAEAQALEEATAEGSNEKETESGMASPNTAAIETKRNEQTGAINASPKRAEARPLICFLARTDAPSETAEQNPIPQCNKQK